MSGGAPHRRTDVRRPTRDPRELTADDPALWWLMAAAGTGCWLLALIATDVPFEYACGFALAGFISGMGAGAAARGLR